MPRSIIELTPVAELPLRPHFKIPTNDTDIDVLFDTGAVYPVWTKSSKALEDSFSHTKPAGFKFWLSGFGGPGGWCDAYIIPKIEIRKDVVLYNVTCAHFYIDDSKPRLYDLLLSPALFGSASIGFNLRKNWMVLEDEITLHKVCHTVTMKDKHYVTAYTQSDSFPSEMYKQGNVYDKVLDVLDVTPDSEKESYSSINELMGTLWPIYCQFYK